MCSCADERSDGVVCDSAECDTVTDLCGTTRACGMCPGAYDACQENACVCVDSRLDPEVCGSAECDTVGDHCDVARSCGTCTNPSTCQNNTCLNLVLGLVAHYPFDGNANDMSENDNDGVVTGATLIADRFGNGNSAYDFDGDDYIDCGNDASLDLVNTATISLWVNADAVNNGYILAKKDYFYYAVGFHLNIENIWVYINENTTTFIAPFNRPDEWVHFAFTYDVGGGLMKLYLDGVFTTEFAITESIDVTTDNLQIGRRLPNDYYLDGEIDDIYIYNRVLSGEEIHALYCEGGWCLDGGLPPL